MITSFFEERGRFGEVRGELRAIKTIADGS
jgi:hypothetical protein